MLYDDKARTKMSQPKSVANLASNTNIALMFRLNPKGVGELVSRLSPKQLEFVCIHLLHMVSRACLDFLRKVLRFLYATYLLCIASFCA